MLKGIAAVSICALAWTSLASAHYRIIEQKEKSYELVLKDVTIPGSTAGTVIFKACEDCDPQSLRVTAATLYVVDGIERSFVEFQQAAAALRSRDGAQSDAGVYVHYDMGTLLVNRIRLNDPRK